MVSKGVGLMLDLCDAGTLEQGAAVPQQLLVAGQTASAPGTGTNLAAHVVVRKASEAVAEAAQTRNSAPLFVVARNLWAYCQQNPNDERA